MYVFRGGSMLQPLFAPRLRDISRFASLLAIFCFMREVDRGLKLLVKNSLSVPACTCFLLLFLFPADTKRLDIQARQEIETVANISPFHFFRNNEDVLVYRSATWSVCVWASKVYTIDYSRGKSSETLFIKGSLLLGFRFGNTGKTIQK